MVAARSLGHSLYERAAPEVLTDHAPLRYYVGYLRGRPVAAAELTVSPNAVGLYGVSTLRPLCDAGDEGHQVAILQAAEAGVRLYQQIGFETFGLITEFQPRLRR